ncbi:MAG: hypothetical protein KDA32_14105 [Phycisphaerales bacterium]|nr:hypothetical protein [Phycisphaerales bacterium]
MTPRAAKLFVIIVWLLLSAFNAFASVATYTPSENLDALERDVFVLALGLNQLLIAAASVTRRDDEPVMLVLAICVNLAAALAVAGAATIGMFLHISPIDGPNLGLIGAGLLALNVWAVIHARYRQIIADGVSRIDKS